MKKLLVVAAVFGALTLWAASAQAQIPPIIGPNWSAHFTDASSDYVNEDGTWVPRAPLGTSPAGFAPTTVAIGDENRTIFNVDTFLTQGTSYASLGSKLQGLVYDLQLGAIIGNPSSGTVTLEYTALGRNPVTDPKGTAPAGSGGVIELYSQATGTTIETVAGNGAQAWEQNADASVPNHLLTGAADAYPDINDPASASSLYLQGVFCPTGVIAEDANDDNAAYVGDPILLKESIDLDTDTGTSFVAYIHITGGYAQSQFDTNVFGPGEDISLSQTYVLPGNGNYADSPAQAGNWAISSSDPVKAAPSPVPEPATMTLFGLGLAGLFTRIRRKK